MNAKSVVTGVTVTLLGLAAWELFGRDLVNKLKGGV